MGSDAETTIRGSAAEQVIAPIAFVRVLYEPEVGVRGRPALPLGLRPMPIGRAIEGHGITVPDPKVSRRHAIFHPTKDGAGARIEDTSSNGTFVNGRRIEGSVTLADNDIVRVGDTFV